MWRGPRLPGGLTISDVTGNTAGLKPSQKKALERTFQRRVPPDQLVTPELAKHLAWISRDIGRQVGVLINRRGQIEEAFVGEPERIYLPDVGRQRAGAGRLRGLRHVHTTLGDGGLTRYDYADLTKLRLDAVATIHVDDEGRPGAFAFAYPAPGVLDAKDRYRTERAPSIFEADLDFGALVGALEEELARAKAGRDAADHRTRAVLVGVYTSKHDGEWRLTELRELATTAGVVIADEMVQVRNQVDSKYVVGKGKLEEVTLRCLDVGAQLIVFDHDMSPAQARAVAAATDLKVIDRTQLILDIFAQHAQSSDGKLQVELAQLKYNLPRLTDLDAGLSRLTGGIGGRGPGETKLEVNRRRARDRITRLERAIERLSAQRHLRRVQRERSKIPIVSIVGYTNAGKSTLLNRLTASHVLVADQLFATLDPASRKLRVGPDAEAIITDTVGFIRDLPPDLMRAFRATLEELEGADLLLHVVDISDPMRNEKMGAVNALLADLELGGIPRVVVFNKADQVEGFEAQALARKNDGVSVSAVTGSGIDKLIDVIAHRLWPNEAIAEDNAWATGALTNMFGRKAPSETAVTRMSSRERVLHNE